MRVRDILIVGVSLLCLFLAWWHQGAMCLLPSFRVSVDDDETRVFVMAKPLVIDPEGDGSPLMVAATGTGHFGIYDTCYATGNMEGLFVPINAKKEMYTYGRVLGFGAGSISTSTPSTVLAVLTDDYRLRVYSSESRYTSLKWEMDVASAETWGNVLHAAVAVMPERVYAEDEGMVTVAVKVVGTDDVELTLFAAFNGADGARRWQFLSDSMNDAGDVVAEAEGRTPLNVDEVADVFPIAAGEAGWNTTMGSVRLISGIPMIGRLYAKPWTTYREAVIAALPHHYNHPWDAQIRPHVIYPQKAAQKQRSRAGSKLTFLRNNRLVRMDAEDYGALGERLNLWNEEAAASKKSLLDTKNSPQNAEKQRRRKLANALVYHGRTGIEILHLYTGNTITHVLPLKANDGAYYHDINDDFHIEVIKTQIGPRTDMDGEHGVDLIDDCMGMVLTGVPVAEDEIFNATICDTEGFFGNLDLIHHFVDGDVRGEGSPHTLNTLELIGSKNIVSQTTRSTPPLVVQVHRAMGRGVTQMERYAVFLIDSGLTTCVDPSRGRVLWRTQTDATFSDLAEVIKADNYEGIVANEGEKESYTRPYPHLVPYSFYQRNPEDDPNHVSGGRSRYRRTDPYVIAVGERAMTVLNTKNGKVVRRVTLPEPPIAPLIVTDFNGDGINDVIVVTRRHIYGFVGGARSSTSTVTSLMLLMVSLLVLLFVAREVAMKTDEGVEEYLPPAATAEEIAQHRPRTHKRATD